jgi:hypothetical protein
MRKINRGRPTSDLSLARGVAGERGAVTKAAHGKLRRFPRPPPTSFAVVDPASADLRGGVLPQDRAALGMVRAMAHVPTRRASERVRVPL